ncbi:ATP-binding cassette domain-containing protein [Nakamurella leprariae]|uniref:ABC-F family ATP-binding cassette domain-containing protein n=1 Tax=Nakamurella leprariae TaxID=2803911 RepID=A0A938YB82_9ACTN|nr:ATP-binding cassette domain-containing protein [Nakamurella leprariae]MBM9466609.1 ABC-F family ATP-binding cassette domain-containing protein [Nakamurella leprariae]
MTASPTTTSGPSSGPSSSTVARSVRATDLTVRRQGRTVLDGLSLSVPPGRRLGVVGENGTGKSTLLLALAGELAPDGGRVTVPADTVHLPQEPAFANGDTIRAVLDRALAPLHASARRVEELSAELAGGGPEVAEEYARVLEWAVRHDAWDADRRTEVAARRLGVHDLDRTRTVGTLSGGQRVRLALAAAIARVPDCLLLDEPTNHLDRAAVAVLEEMLLATAGAVVLVSHDRVLLDRTCTHLLDLDPTRDRPSGAGTRMSLTEDSDPGDPGVFTRYLAERSAARERWDRAYAEQEERLAELRAATVVTDRAVAPGRGPRDHDKFITHFKGEGVQRTVARRARDAQRRLDDALRHRLPEPPPPPRVLLPEEPVTAATAPDEPIVEVADLHVCGRLRLPRLVVPRGGHLLLTGANGTGKSTLLAVLAGRLAADRGDVAVRAARIGHLPQDGLPVPAGAEPADPAATAADQHRRWVGADAAEATPLVELGLVDRADTDRPLGMLSVGQLRRVALAMVLAARPDLLLLDEPTNHLSPALAAELEAALTATPTTVLLTGHDRWLVDTWPGTLVRIGADGTTGTDPETRNGAERDERPPHRRRRLADRLR